MQAAEEVPTRARRALRRDLWLLAGAGVLVLALTALGWAFLYRALYSPEAFAERYLEMLSGGRAGEALRVPGVAVGSAELQDRGWDPGASDALLRRDALTALSDVSVANLGTHDGVTTLRIGFTAGGHHGDAVFHVEQDGWTGVVPRWRFETSPLALIDLSVKGSMSVAVNGFTIDKRQVSPDGMGADPDKAVPLLVFTPGLYSFTVDTPLSSSPGVAVLADSPMLRSDIEVSADPTPQFLSTVQKRVDEFLGRCTAQQVLHPTGCPFGIDVENRLASPPSWTIVRAPAVQLKPDGANWSIPYTEATVHVTASVQSIYDGTVVKRSADVPFAFTGHVFIMPDGSASIMLSETRLHAD